MKPLSLEFLEKFEEEGIDYSCVLYDDNLNLSVEKSTGQPAITIAGMDTSTFTKAQAESSDSDASKLTRLMDTTTHTRVQLEASDSDKDRANIQGLFETSTLTAVKAEQTDQDK